MPSSKTSPRDFSLFSLFTAGLACFVPLASAWGSIEQRQEYSAPAPSDWSASHTLVPTAYYGTAHASGWMPQNTSGPYPTGGVHHHTTWTHKTPEPTPSSTIPGHASTYAGPVASSTGGAAAMATSFAGLVFAGGVAVLAL